MGKGSTELIEAWFAEHGDDGEFIHHDRAVPYAVIGPSNGATRLIFTTKPAIVSSALDKNAAAKKIGMIGRYGLPNRADLHWLSELIRRHVFLFLGDMDPVDILIFAWLRESLHPTRVAYLGVNDHYMNAIKIRSVEGLSIPCVPAERRANALLKKVFPDFVETVGPKCAKYLKEGRKIELDAIVSAKGPVASILRPALDRRSSE